MSFSKSFLRLAVFAAAFALFAPLALRAADVRPPRPAGKIAEGPGRGG